MRAVAESDLKVARSLDPGDGEFGRFLRTLEGADDPGALIDAFLEAPREYPIREGDARIHFVYRGAATDLAITGDMLGTRQDVAMVRAPGTDLYYYTADLIPEARLSYAFLRDGEMITDPLNPLVVPTLIYNAEREHVFGDRPQPMSELRMPGWRRPDHLREPAAETRGTVESLAFEDRRGSFEIQVYLPHGYEDSDASYPVVYYHGPSPTELSAIPTTLDNLIADGEIPPVIAAWTDVQLGAGSYYSSFWADKIVPAIDARFRTVQSAAGRVSVGGGSGARAGLHIAIDHPEMTSGLAMLSIRALDLQWDPLMPRLGTPETRPLRLYVDWGIYGLRNPQEVWDNRTKSAERAQQLRDLGYEVRGGEVIDGVGWASWRNHADAVLRAILPSER
jgi:enterochelin esterase family protein